MPPMRLSENGYFPQSLRQAHPAWRDSKYFDVFLRLIPLKRDVFLDLAKNLSFSDSLIWVSCRCFLFIAHYCFVGLDVLDNA